MGLIIVDVDSVTRVYPKELSPRDILNVYAVVSSNDPAPYDGYLAVSIIDEGGLNYGIDSHHIVLSGKYEDYNYSNSFDLSNYIPADSTGKWTVRLLVTNGTQQDIKDIPVTIFQDVRSAKSIVFNEKLGFFVGESSLISPFYVAVGSNFISSKDRGFYQNKEGITLKLYGEDFEPFVEFIVNGNVAEKVFDALIINLSDVGLKSVEYWTKNQYSKHEWPVLDDEVQAHPWIDPEYKEDRWYVPVHPEIMRIDETVMSIVPSQSQECTGNCVDVTVAEFHPDIGTGPGIIFLDDKEFPYISATNNGQIFTVDNYTAGDLGVGDHVQIDANYMAWTNYMRGQWMKVRFTFNAGEEFKLREVITMITQSEI